MSESLRIVVIGDRVQPSSVTAESLRRLLDPVAQVDAFDWDASDFSALALAAERGLAVPIPDAWATAVTGADVLVTHFFPVRRDLMDSAPHLKVIATLRHGQEHLDLAAALERGIRVINNPGREAEPVSDFALLLILESLRGLHRASGVLIRDGWLDADQAAVGARNVASVVVGLVGFGHVGQLLARKLSGLSPRILVADPFISAESARDSGAELVGLDELLRTADVVSIHARLVPETRGLIGAAQLALMKPTAILVNTARAELIHEESLIAALRHGSIRGAALDVFWQEPLPLDHPLRGMPNVLLSPHMAGSTQDAPAASARLLARRLVAVLDSLALLTGQQS